MSKYIESSDSETLKTLYQYVESGDLALPDFQRNLVWGAKDAHALLVSLANDNPAGSLLALRNGSSAFRQRKISEAPELKPTPPYLLLDGQQRLTTLYQALSGKGDNLFFVDLRVLEERKDFEDSLFFLRAGAQRGAAKKRRERYATFAGQVEDLVLPLAVLFSDGGMDKWIKDVRRSTQDDGLEDRLDVLKRTWFEPILAYRFPWVVLRAGTPPDAVCNMFEELNKRGIRLSVFDLLVARFWTSQVLLRDMWQETRDASPELQRFGIEPYYLLQAISLAVTYESSKETGGAAVADCKRGTVIALGADDVKEWWPYVSDAIEEVLKRLADDCGVWSPKLLPYDPIVIPLAAVLAHRKRTLQKYPQGADRRRLNRWFWCSVFGQSYEQGAISQAAKDFVELNRWLDGGPEPSAVAEFSFDAGDLDDVGPRQTALYRGVVDLVLSGTPEPRDFRTFEPVARSVWESEADNHHLFPQAFLRDTLEVKSEAERNVVLNRTLIDRETNKWISKKAPSDYFAELKEQHADNDEQMDEFLLSHLIPPGPESPIWTDDYDRFLQERRDLVAERIREVTS